MTTRNTGRPPAMALFPFPATLVAATLGIGILAGDGLPVCPLYWIAVCGVSVAGLFLFKRPGMSTVLAILLVSSTGAAIQTVEHEQSGSDIGHLTFGLARDADVDVALAGRISSFVIRDSVRMRFYLEPERIHGSEHVVPVVGKVRVSLGRKFTSPSDSHRDQCADLTRGMFVVLRGALSRPNARTNPADFDYREFLRRKGVNSLLYVSNLDRCFLLDDTSSRIAIIRNWFKAAIEASVPPTSRALPTALITGDRAGLDPVTRQEFAVSGLMHLLAISGLHVLFVGLAAYGLLKSMLIRLQVDWRLTESISSAITLVLLLVYALMTGAAPSVVRASVMAGVLLSSRPLFRTSNGINSLGVAATVVLLIDPDSLFTAGFQLSFLAVFGLITAGAFVTSLVNRSIGRTSLRWCLGLLGASAVATISTSPIMIHHFGYVPLAGLFLNLVAIPLASLLLVSSIFTTVFASFWPAVAEVMGQATDLLSVFLEFLAKIGTGSSDWTLVRPPGSLPYLFLPLTTIFALVPNISLSTRRHWLVLAVSLPAFHTISEAAAGHYVPDLEVIFFDIGHGDAALVKFPSGYSMLIDAGNQTRGWDYGERVILPHLHKERIGRLDAVVVSHPHGDHFGGLPSILRSEKVGCVYDNGKKTETQLYAEYDRLVGEVVRCHEALTSGLLLDADSSARVEVLAPPAGYEHEGENNESVVLRIRFGRTSILFTGDVERHAERILTRNYCNRLEADVIKVPHHGSRTSSSPDLVACVKARWAVVSVGRADKYGLPDEEILDRWTEAGVEIISTRTGAVRLRSDGEEIERIQ